MSESVSLDTESVWAQFHDSLRRFVLARVNDEGACDDILQDVFVRIHTKIDSLRDDTKLQAWVFQIARNAIIDYYRRGKAPMELDESQPSPEPEDDTEVQLAQSLRRMLALLPAADRDVIEWDTFEGLTQKEIGERLGISLSGAKSRVQRARARLRDLFLECCHLEFDRVGGVVDFHPRAAYCVTCARDGVKGC